VTAVKYEGGFGKGFSLQDCRDLDVVIMARLAGLAAIFLVLFVDTVLGM
jgi:hypothetical protein